MRTARFTCRAEKFLVSQLLEGSILSIKFLLVRSVTLVFAFAFAIVLFNSAASFAQNSPQQLPQNPSNSTKAQPSSAAVKSASQTKPQVFTATAYALRGRTASGSHVRRGVIAADRRVLPMGTRVRLETTSGHSGEYIVADTGGAIRGNKIDIWVPSNGEAMRFGRRKVKLTVMQYPTKSKKVAPKTGTRRKR